MAISRQAKQRKPGPNIIRAWFDTVVNPLIQALHVEVMCLNGRDWTWNHWRHVLESILPIELHLDEAVLPNLRQFFGFYPDLKELANTHNVLVGALSERCGVLQDLLQSDPALRRLYEDMSSGLLKELGDHARVSPDTPNSEEEELAVFAEYIVNNRGVLPDYYTTATLWNAGRDRFLALLGQPSITAEYDALVGVADQLLECARGFVALLEERRDELSTENDVPIVKQAA